MGLRGPEPAHPAGVHPAPGRGAVGRAAVADDDVLDLVCLHVEMSAVRTRPHRLFRRTHLLYHAVLVRCLAPRSNHRGRRQLHNTERETSLEGYASGGHTHLLWRTLRHAHLLRSTRVFRHTHL